MKLLERIRAWFNRPAPEATYDCLVCGGEFIDSLIDDDGVCPDCREHTRQARADLLLDSVRDR